jgi:hypothetical protein
MSQLIKTGIDPKIWGKPSWEYYHYVTFNYPENPTPDDKNNYKTWAKMFGLTLPCKTCSDGYLALFDNPVSGVSLTDDALASIESFVEWGYKMRTEIQKKIGGEQITYVAFLTKYINILPASLRNQLVTLQNRQFGIPASAVGTNSFRGTGDRASGYKSSSSGQISKYSNNMYRQMKPKSGGGCATCGRR